MSVRVDVRPARFDRIGGCFIDVDVFHLAFELAAAAAANSLTIALADPSIMSLTSCRRRTVQRWPPLRWKQRPSNDRRLTSTTDALADEIASPART